MKFRAQFAPFCYSLATVLLLACGSGANDRVVATSSSSLVNDSGESEAAVSASLSEVMESLSDSNLVSSASTLSLYSVNADNSINLERSCAVKDSKAIVSISFDSTRSWEQQTPRFSVTASATASVDISRTWSKDGSAVACAAGGKSAAIDFEGDLSGYHLDIDLSREINRSLERVNLKTSEKFSKELKSSASGARHIEWLSQATLADGSISRSKTVSFSSERSDNFVAKDGTVKSLNLSVKTDEAAPLKVTVIWDKLSKSRQLLSKLIESGKIKSSQAGDGYIEASFEQMLMKFSSETCEVASGTMEAKIYKEDAVEPSKVYQLTAKDGTITVIDITDPKNPAEVNDFDYTPCDLKNFNF